MGLKNLNAKELRRAKRILSALEFYGVKEEEIPLISEIKALKDRVAELEKIKVESEKISSKNKSNSNPLVSETLAAYSTPIESFDPYATR